MFAFEFSDYILRPFSTGNRSIGEDTTVPIERCSGRTEYHPYLQRGIRDSLHIHDWQEQKECPVFCKVHRILPNTIHSKGTFSFV